MLFVTFIAGIFIIIIFELYHRYSHAGRLIKKIPGPPAWPIVGNSLNYARPPDKLFPFMRTLVKDYGYIYQIHGFNTRFVNISNPEDIEKILTSPQYNIKKAPYTFLSPWLAEGLLLSSGGKWQQRRKMLTKAFHFNILKKFAEIFKDCAVSFMNRVENETVNEKTDIMAFISPTALRMMCESAMGIRMIEGSPAINSYFSSIMAFGELFAKRMAKVWLHDDFIFNMSSIAKSQSDVLADLHKFTSNVIDDRRKNSSNVSFELIDDNSESHDSSKKLAMLDLLLENERNGLLNGEGIREEVDTFMFEGFDTTSVTLTFLNLTLANHSTIQDKVYEEMMNIIGDSDRPPTVEELNEMKYLDCCIKETMRLYSTVPFIARQLVKDTILSGYTVPADTTCFIFIYDLHRRADLYPDPLRFDPDRFLPENSLNRNPYAYIPFSAGMRNCIGQKFAMLELKIIMSSLLRKYRIEPVTKLDDIVFKVDMVLRPKNNVYVRFRKRE